MANQPWRLRADGRRASARTIGEFFVFAIHWWDKSTNSLRGMLCNNSGPAACNVDSYSNSTLKWDGKQLTIDMQFPEHGKKMLWHEVWSDITSTSFTQTGDVGEVGGPLKRAVTIHGTKVANARRVGKFAREDSPNALRRSVADLGDGVFF